MKHLSEYAPTWKSIEDVPPPAGTKIILRTEYGTAIIGQYYPDVGYTHWCGLPKMAKDANTGKKCEHC
jgi:hypothetical protein